MASRPGLTVMEVLIASSLGVVVVGLSIQQLMEFFRLQQVLTVRTQLRADTKMAQERISQKLRYAAHVLDDGHGGGQDAVFAVIPVDSCADGYYCAQDTVELVYWGAQPDPFHAGRFMLYEKTLTVPAYQLPGSAAQLRTIFDAKAGQGRMVAPYITHVSIQRSGDRLYRFTVGAQKEQPLKRPPITFEYTELVANRFLPGETVQMPPLPRVMEKIGIDPKAIPSAPSAPEDEEALR